MNEEGELDLLPLLPDEDHHDWMLDQGGHTVKAPALVCPVPHPHQLGEDLRLSTRLDQVKEHA